MHSVSTTNTWTVCIHYSGTHSVVKLLSRVDNSLIMCRGQFISTTNTEEWTECPALWKRKKKERTSFCICGRWWNHLESRDVLCVHCPKYLIVSAGPGYRTLNEWFQCLYKNVFDRLFVAISHSINGSWERMLRLDTSQLAPIWIPIVH